LLLLLLLFCYFVLLCDHLKCYISVFCSNYARYIAGFIILSSKFS
jgi:hypothetical protein